MSSFNYLLSRTYLLSEAKGEKGEKNIKRNLPPAIGSVFKSASQVAKLKGGIPTREGKKAAISYITDYIEMKLGTLDIEDEKSLFRFTNIPAQGPLIDFLETSIPQGSDLTYADILKDITDADIEIINTKRNRELQDVVAQSMVQRGDERQTQYDARAAAVALKNQEKEEFKQMAKAARVRGDSELENAMDSIGTGLEGAIDTLQVEFDRKIVQDSAGDVLDRLEEEMDTTEGDVYGPKVYEALHNVRGFIESKVTTVEQLQSLINQLLQMEGYQEIAYALSAAVKGIKSTRPNLKEEEAEDDFDLGQSEDFDPGYSELPEQTDEEIVNVIGYPHRVQYGDDGAVVTVTTSDPGQEIDVNLVNKYLQSGYPISRAIAAATSYTNEPNGDEDLQMMVGESYTSGYLTEQVRKDSFCRPNNDKSVSFREKYTPKTHWQLEELRRYGL